MEEAIKLLVFDFINFISFLKKQPNVPKSWLSRIKRLELKCDNLGLTSKSAVESPPVINVVPLAPPSSLPETPSSRLSSKSSSSQVICDEAYVADWDRDDFGHDRGELPPEPSSALDLHPKISRNKWSLKPEECDRDQLMDQSIKIGKMYVKNFKSLISSTLGKKVEKTALLTNDFRFLLYKANKPKIDTVLDIRGALIQSNKFKSKRFTITCSTDKVDTIEFEASDEEERDSWVYALFKASKGILASNGCEGSSNKFDDENAYQKVQETDNYNLIIEDGDDEEEDMHYEDDDDIDSHIIYKSPPNGQPVASVGDYPLVDDDTDEDFEDDTNFDQEEIDLLPAPSTPAPPESLYEFEDSSSYTSSSSNSSLSLCSPVDTSDFIEPPSLPAKNMPPLKAPTDIPPKSKCLSPRLSSPRKEEEGFSVRIPSSESPPPELPPKKGRLQKKSSLKKTPRKKDPIEEEEIKTPIKSVEAPFPPPPRQSLDKREPKKNSSLSKEEDQPVKSKKKMSMKKRFLRNSSSHKSYEVNPEAIPSSPPPVTPISMDMIKNELIQKVELRNKRMQLKQGGESSLDDIRSNASSYQSDSKDILEVLGKKPSEVRMSNHGVKPQVLKPKPVLKQNQVVGKVSSKGSTSNPTSVIPDSPRTEYKKKMEKNKTEEVQKQFETIQIDKGSSTDDASDEEDW